MKTPTKQNIIIVILIIIISWYVGFKMGSNYSKGKTKIEYIVGKPVNDTVYVDSTMVEEEIDVNEPPFIIKYDTITKEVYKYIEVDTSKIISEYMTKKKYTINLFNNDSLGRLDIFPELQANTLIKVPYQYIPIAKVVTKYRENKYIPLVYTSYNTDNYVGVGGAIIKNKVGLGYKYNKNFSTKNDYHEVQFILRIK